MSGESKALNVNCNESVENVKLKISRVEGVSLDQIHVIYEGNPVEQGNLNDFSIKEGDTLLVVLKNASVIRINVQQQNGASIALEVEPSELVQNIKNMLETKLGYLADQQVLTFNGREVKDGRLTHHGISQHATLALKLKTIQVFVKSFDGKTFTLVVQAADTVDNLKNKIREQTGVVPSQQRLLYGAKQLDGGLLSQYGIRDCSEIQMVGRVRGG